MTPCCSILQTFLAQRKQDKASDKSGIWISNDYDNFMQISGFFSVIGYFMWIVGLATLIAGVVGICNIMLIAVKERTRELGIRKAMGASNRSIITLVLTEAVIITLIFGYVGMMIGLGLTQLGAMALGSDNEMFCNPTCLAWRCYIMQHGDGDCGHHSRLYSGKTCCND